VLEVAKKRVHLRGPEGEDKGWISHSEIDRRLVVGKPKEAEAGYAAGLGGD
jgi:hypothetical protein